MSAPKSSPQRASQRGTAAFTKAINVVAHYVDFSDHSSSWSGSQSDGEGTETPDNNEDLREPLLQSSSPASDSKAELQGDVEQSSDESSHMDAMPADKVATVSEELQNPAQVEVQSDHEHSDGSSLSDDGAQTPTKEDLRTPLLQSQPVDQEDLTHASSGSPKVAASSGLGKLNSGLLDPSLLQQLLDDHAPPPDVPEPPSQHAEPVVISAHENGPPNGNHGRHQPLNITACRSYCLMMIHQVYGNQQASMLPLFLAPSLYSALACNSVVVLSCSVESGKHHHLPSSLKSHAGPSNSI